MTDHASTLLPEMIRAANTIERIGHVERRRLMADAAKAIRDMRAAVKISGKRKDWSPDQIDFRLLLAARDAETWSDAATAALMIEATEYLQTLRMLLGIQDEVAKDAKPEGRA